MEEANRIGEGMKDTVKKNGANTGDNGVRNEHRSGPISRATGNATVMLALTGNGEIASEGKAGGTQDTRLPLVYTSTAFFFSTRRFGDSSAASTFTAGSGAGSGSTPSCSSGGG
jgi:hypothetical protein